jgi:predicted Fe-Mo cluster-binding NifX family protein
MRLCIPTGTQEGNQARVFAHFGSAPFFTIHDTETGLCEVVKNINAAHDHGTCQPMNSLAGRQLDAVISLGMGAGAVRKVNAQGLRVYRAAPGTVGEIAAQFKAGRVSEFSAENACVEHDCH